MIRIVCPKCIGKSLELSMPIAGTIKAACPHNNIRVNFDSLDELASLEGFSQVKTYKQESV